jgi:hypothetical protein
LSIQITGELTLVVDRPSIDGQFRVAIRDSVAATLPHWGRATRTSPIFQTSAAKIPLLTGRRSTRVCFIGPISPDELPAGFNLFLSYGVYNAIIFAQGQTEFAALDALLAKLAKTTPWEMWELVGDKVQGGGYSPLLKTASSATHPPMRAIAHGDHLRAASEEYQTLLAVTRSRAAPYLSETADELNVLDEALNDKIKNVELHQVRKLQWLVNINAALSRFSSQSFAGTSPILGTECHFWTHSLLGIGLATKALLHFRRYVDKRAALAQFPARIAAFKSMDPVASSLKAQAATHANWSSLTLPAPKAKASADVAQLPLIVCFSGRDGFKSTTFTLSAPLEVMQSGNTCAWSLQTLTHELSHIFVESIIAALLEDDFSKPVWSTKILAIYNGTRQPANLHEQLQEFMFFAFARLEMEDQGKLDQIDLPEDAPKQLIRKHYHTASELLAHIFDFVHFFQQDPTSYVNSVWSSWDVIPNIESRIDEYIIRSLCALHYANLTVENGTAVSIDMLLAKLQGLSIPRDQYVTPAIKALKDRRDHFLQALGVRIPLIKLARAVMYSPEVASIFAQTRPVSKTAAKVTGYRAKVFTKNRPVDNPIRFILEHCLDRSSDPAKSLWVLTQLAFSGGADA